MSMKSDTVWHSHVAIRPTPTSFDSRCSVRCQFDLPWQSLQCQVRCNEATWSNLVFMWFAESEDRRHLKKTVFRLTWRLNFLYGLVRVVCGRSNSEVQEVSSCGRTPELDAGVWRVEAPLLKEGLSFGGRLCGRCGGTRWQKRSDGPQKWPG